MMMLTIIYILYIIYLFIINHVDILIIDILFYCLFFFEIGMTL